MSLFESLKFHQGDTLGILMINILLNDNEGHIFPTQQFHQ